MPRIKQKAQFAKSIAYNATHYKNIKTQVDQKFTSNQKSDKFIQTSKYFSTDSDLRFTLSVLIFGLSYKIASNIFKFNGIEVCSEKVFYYYQTQISPIIIELAKNSSKKYAQNITNNTIISIDGAWDHRRHGSTCIVTFIDIKTRKIIDFEISFISKQYVNGTTKECSRNLEKTAMEILVERWKNSEKVDFYIHDNDGVTRNIIEKSKWKIKEILDIGHSLKAIKKKIESFNKREGKPFNGLMESMNRYISTLFRNSSISSEKRIELYYNMPNHYVGNHSKCIHSNNTK